MMIRIIIIAAVLVGLGLLDNQCPWGLLPKAGACYVRTP